MRAKKLSVLLLFVLLLCSGVHIPLSAGQEAWWNQEWSYRQELILDSIITKKAAANQPVDMMVRFESPCWASNDTVYSVRVICHNNNEDFLLESQVYNLAYSDQTHISSCNLVFLIPPETDGIERYYVYYDDTPTPAPNYPDHVSIKDSSYFYEPVPGYPLESHFYEISQQGTIRYIVSQEGQFLWYSTAQYVTKLKEGTTEVIPKNGEAIASFEYAYYYGDAMWQYNSTSQHLLEKEILYDGNLMVCCKIRSGSSGGDLQTTAVYKYYYSPTLSERIQVHVVHEALKDCHVYPTANTDGSYASLQCGGIQSSSIAELNFGEISPYIHFYSEQNIVEQQKVDLHPEYTQENPVLWLFQTADDVDLGKNSWVSFDEGTSGSAHAILFGSPSVVKAGNDEQDGIQLKAYESNYPHLPGLEYTVAAIECNRNAYERNGSKRDLMIPKGFLAEFDAEFFSSPTGGYQSVEQEAEVFQVLVPMKPSITVENTYEANTSTNRFSLTVLVHNAPAFPLGAVWAAVTGRRFSYVTVEVYQYHALKSVGTAGRVPLRQATISEDASLREKIKAVVHMVDVRNLSFFKQVLFQQLEEGRYLIKIFRENSGIAQRRSFIGYALVNLSKDSRIPMFCRPQGSCQVTLINQRGQGVQNASVMFMQEGMIISQNHTNETGVALLTAPCNRKDHYQFTIVSQGFEVANESLRLRYRTSWFSLKKSITLNQYDWRVTLVDRWGLSPEINVTPRLTSAAMQIPTTLFANQETQNSFQFHNLPSATYLLQILYKSFLVEKEVPIPSDDESLVFPAEFPVVYHVFDMRGNGLSSEIVQMSRGGKSQEITCDGSLAVFSVPPGLYQVRVLSQGNVIGQRSLLVVGERTVDLITNQESVYPLVGLVIACILGVVGAGLGITKKEPVVIAVLFMLGILVISLMLPWWSLQGFSSDLETSSTLYLIPLNLVTMTSTASTIAGELSSFPEIFRTIMLIIPILTCIAGFLGLTTLFLQKKKRWMIFFFVGTVGILLCSLIVFIGAMSAFTEVGVGSFLGEGSLGVTVQGQENIMSVSCHWGPGIGFWLYLSSIIIFGFSVSITLYERRKKRNALL